MRRIGLVVVAGWVGLWSGQARAQSAATCSWDFSTHTLNVAVNGIATTIDSDPLAGSVTVDGVHCGDTSIVETISVTGGALADRVTFTGRFMPGLSYESDYDEIEINLNLGAGTDTAIVKLGGGYDVAFFQPDGLSTNNDADTDVVMSGVEVTKVYGQGGQDIMDAGGFNGTGKLYMYGGDGDDQLFGSPYADYLYGDADNDYIVAGGGNDIIYDGNGIDYMLGDDGNDRFEQGATADNTWWYHDTIIGGAGVDTVDYGDRSNPVSVTIGANADDGEVNEADDVQSDVENVVTGAGNDTLVGNGLNNTLTGGAGDDDIYGGGGVDRLHGGAGADLLVGDAGGDWLYGEADKDQLDGGDGADKLYGGDGDDSLDGGAAKDQYFGEAGNDTFYNTDGLAESVDCGDGTDDPEPDPLDAYTACELI